MHQRAIEHPYASPQVGTRPCNVCGQTTREGKPFCSEHVEQHGYVREILTILANKEAEEERVRLEGPQAVDPAGLTAQELLLHLRLNGSRTIERLSRELQLGPAVVSRYVDALVEHGEVSTGRTTRGSVVVQARRRVG
ncbi:MAG: hypothetical protein AB7N76_08235 [Planctomycetota bacterium]